MAKREQTENNDNSKEFIGDYQPNYDQVIPLLRQVYGVTECEPVGHGLSCYPCPYHKMEDHDRLVIDPRNKLRRIVCAKEPLLNRFVSPDGKHEQFNELEEKLDAIAEKLKKPPTRYTDTLLSEIIERHYVLTNLIITVHDKKTKAFKSYKYNPREGIYEEITTDEIETDLLQLFQKITPVKPSLSLLNEMAKKVHKLTERPGDEDIFIPVKGNLYYLVGRVRDIEVNTLTGEVKILEKDPINRPFNRRLEYDFAMDPPTEPPPEFEIFKKYTTPKFQVNVVILLAKAFIYSGLHYIFVVVSRRHGTGKTAFFYILDKLAGGTVKKVEPKHFKNEFFESRLVDKTIMLLEEYRGKYETINDKLKEFASNTTSIEGDQKYEKDVKAKNMLAVGITTNKMEIPWNFLNDPAFMERWDITPFVRYMEGKSLPEWVEPSDNPEIRATRERLVLYIVTQLVPKVIRNELKPVTYKDVILRTWVDQKDDDDKKVAKLKPPDGIDDFLKEVTYKESSDKNNHAQFMTLDEAFELYLKWCDKQEIYLPAMDIEFKDWLKYGNKSTYVVKKKIEKDGKVEEIEGIYIKKANLADFL